MGIRGFVEEQVSSLLDFGWSRASRVLSAAKSVVLTVVGDEDPDGDEELADAEMFGQAPLLYRPQDPTDAGRCETMFVRWGDERVVIATKDRRFQVEPGIGEVRVVALGADGARQAQLILKPDGVIALKGVRIELGDEGVANTIGLGNIIKSHFDTLRTELEQLRLAHNTHNHPTAPTGPVSLPSVLMPAAFSTTPDVESRHRVEN